MTTERPSWLPADVDPSRPSVARVYDFYLGGSHNFEADREFGRQVVEAFPGMREAIRDNRRFLRRSVLHACREGIDQFIDLGSGIPTVGNVHEVAQAAVPGARVVYVDHDPVAVVHGEALLAGNPGAAAVDGDLRSPADVLETVAATGLLDLSRPVAVLLVSVLHFVQDEDRPADCVARYMEATAPGSLLVLSHGSMQASSATMSAVKVYDRDDSPGRLRFRTRAEIESLFGALTLVEPGLVDIPRWRPELSGDAPPAEDEESHPGLAGVGRRG